MSYPAFAHLGFKFICSFFMVSTYIYQREMIQYKVLKLQQRSKSEPKRLA